MNIVISGYGFMGRQLEQVIQTTNHTVTDRVDSFGKGSITSFDSIETIPDVLIDFSHPSQLDDILSFAISHKVPLVLATTGYTKNHIHQIQEASSVIPILHTSNTSYGIQVLLKAIKQLQAQLPEADIEIIETHHRHKIDAPSGTAKMITNELQDNSQDISYGHYGNEKRQQQSIGVHSIRGGSVAGIHEVQFLMDDEVITITHKAENKLVFARGALKAAEFIVCQNNGLYTMKDTVKE